MSGQAPKAKPPPMHSRTKEKITTDEDAGQVLNLGEYQKEYTLSLSEALILLRTVMAKRQSELKDPMPESDTLKKTLGHLELFAKFPTQTSAIAVENAMMDILHHTEPFERSQLASLVCSDVDEATELIPSLRDKIDEDVLQNVLDRIAKARALV